jgi:ABC-type glycerol-3-phosphate transport system permease component
MKTVRNFVIYLRLIGGSLVFIWSFLWMAATSVKFDREMFGDTLRLLPQRPLPQPRSPYVDERLFADVRGPRLAEAVAMIEQRLAATAYLWPNDLERATLVRETARGLYARLLSILPAEVWKEPPAGLREKIDARIDPAIIGDVVAQLRRVFYVGELRASSYDLKEDLLSTPAQAGAWQVGGTAAAKLELAGTPQDPHAELHYDFSRGDTITLSQTFTTTFPLERLHRLQWSLRYDDAWHALTLFVEKNGQRYRAARALESSDFEWVTDFWQEPGPDDRPTKIKT